MADHLLLSYSLTFSISLSPTNTYATQTMSMDFKTTAILVGSTSSIVILIIIFTFVIVLCRRRPPIVNHPRRTRNLPNSDLTSVTVENATFDPSICEISMAELTIATKNFSADLIVGNGSFGFVCRAELSNGVVVAVKKLDPDAIQGFREFSAEMETLGQLSHPNIVRILGYCISGQERVLIYKFLEKRSLDYWLHETDDHDNNDDDDDDDDDDENGSLTWSRRVSITHGVAKGLAYLHGLPKPIIHRDIKSSNVLLDSDFVAHIADFGLARSIDASMSHVSTQVAGTMGYMPPEYWGGYTAATVKADVYSFGVLMLEMATRRRPNWPVVVDEKEVGLAQWAVMMVGQNRYYEMVDFEGVGSEKGVEEYFRIACLCIKESTRERPIMKQVVELLEQLCRLIDIS